MQWLWFGPIYVLVNGLLLPALCYLLYRGTLTRIAQHNRHPAPRRDVRNTCIALAIELEAFWLGVVLVNRFQWVQILPFSTRDVFLSDLGAALSGLALVAILITLIVGALIIRY